MEKEGVAEKKARALVKADNQSQSDWVRHVSGHGPWDESLYDMVVPMSTHSVEDAVDLIAENAGKDVVQMTPQSRKAADDFALAAQVYLVLARKWPDVEVFCDGGNVTLHINTYVMRLDSLKKKLAEAAGAVPGVKRVESGFGPKCKRPSIHRDLEFELPSKVLLVDDEREFVDTLSERLLAREMASTVAYNGEDALSQVARDEPEVMVLDLKMPGIDGMEVLRKVRAERPNVEVIILTGHGSEKDRALAEELGAFAYLQKPVDIDVLTQTMKDAYRKINQAREAGDLEEGH
jgi:CheY-like chemotaxis protein